MYGSYKLTQKQNQRARLRKVGYFPIYQIHTHFSSNMQSCQLNAVELVLSKCSGYEQMGTHRRLFEQPKPGTDIWGWRIHPLRVISTLSGMLRGTY